MTDFIELLIRGESTDITLHSKFLDPISLCFNLSYRTQACDYYIGEIRHTEDFYLSLNVVI